MKRFYTYLLLGTLGLGLLLASPAAARTNLDRGLQTALEQAQQNHRPGATQQGQRRAQAGSKTRGAQVPTPGMQAGAQVIRHQAIEKALRHVTLTSSDIQQGTGYIWLDYSQFEQLNKLATQEKQNKQLTLINLANTYADVGKEYLKLSVWKQERPRYGKETKGIKYIYVTDASSHDTQSIPAEVGVLLQQVRKANPQAKILLAVEMAFRVNLDNLPIQFAHTSNESIQLAGPYQQLKQTADRLEVDLLALDDMIMSDVGERVGIKLGKISAQAFQSKPNLFTKMTKYANEDMWILLSSKQLISFQTAGEDVFTNAFMYIGMTDLGIEFRNTQWAQYIQAVAPFYDIIITYTGDGHTLALSNLETLPDKIGQKYVLFNFYTAEQLSQEDYETYAAYEQEVCKRRVQDENATEKLENATEKLVEEYGDICAAPEWDGTTFLYRKDDNTKQADEALRRTLPAEKQQRLRQFDNEVKQTRLLKDIDYLEFDVYMPDVSKGARR